MREITVNSTRWTRKLIAWCVLVVLPFTVLPMIAIPFFKFSVKRLQTAQDLEVAYTLTQWAPRFAWLALIVGTATALWLWRVSSRWWGRWLIPVAMILALATTWFSHQSPVDRWLFKQPVGVNTIQKPISTC